VLITGESGTGKELFARAIHYTSKRRHFRFVPINCGAMPKDLMESELFGHVKGAFSGADTNKIGLLEEADRGTAFLDEIGELPVDVQVKLNRAIQELEIRPVGEVRDKPIDVRFVAATNVDLTQLVTDGRFREDLYYRLNVLVLDVPPLRERAADIPELAKHFVAKHCAKEDRAVLSIEPEAIELLRAYQWPGNVRELENTLAVAVLMADSQVLTAAQLQSHPIGGSSGLASSVPDGVPGSSMAELVELPYREAAERMNKESTARYLGALLEHFDGNVVKAAAHAGMERGSLYRLMRKCDIRAEDYQSG